MSSLLIGNSHVAALKQAYDAQKIDHNLHFLTIHGNRLLPNLKIDETGALQATNEEVRRELIAQDLDSVSLNTFDNIIIYGCRLRVIASSRKWISKIKSTAKPFSAQALHQSHLDFIHTTSHYKFLIKLQRANLNEDVKIASIPAPYPNEVAPFAQGLDRVNHSEVSKIMNIHKSEVETVGSTFLDTPAALLSKNGYTTHKKFKHKGEDDFSHLNVKGGALVLEEVLNFIRNNAPPQMAAGT